MYEPNRFQHTPPRYKLMGLESLDMVGNSKLIRAPLPSFAGCDATIGLSTMQTDPSKCTKQVVAELSASERDVLSNWVERFSMKYELAGYLTEGANPKSLATMRGGAVDKSS